ncbi:MAG: hypothetical protein EHM72_04330 [Calditrichaeota bacterium]|nr:MAG: hypothetical protein EHM72_04330 [Calditrichota bacterium]
MESFFQAIPHYRKQLQQGAVQTAYRGIMQYILELRTHFKNQHPEYSVPSAIYYGYMDMTYFPLFPPFLKERQLKIAIVFHHEAFRFEVWLAAVNKQVQSKYWKWFKESGWNRYRLVSDLHGADSILEHILAEEPDFEDLDLLTQQIVSGTLTFIDDVQGYLVKHGG